MFPAQCKPDVAMRSLKLTELEWSLQLLDPSLDGDGCCAQLGSYHANSIAMSAELPVPIFAAKSELDMEETLDAKMPLDNLAGNLLPSHVYSDATTSVAEFLWDALLLVRAATGMCLVRVTPVAF